MSQLKRVTLGAFARLQRAQRTKVTPNLTQPPTDLEFTDPPKVGRENGEFAADELGEVAGSELRDFFAIELAREVAALGLADDRQQLEALLLVVLLVESRGGTRVALSPKSLEALLTDIGSTIDVVTLLNAIHQGKLSPLVGRPGDIAPLIIDRDYLYGERLLRHEVELAAHFARRIIAPLHVESTIEEGTSILNDTTQHRLTEEQRRAVDRSYRAKLAVITGGPGTGKTSVLTALVAKLLQSHDAADIALAAPTGKAAHRMGEVIGGRFPGLAEPTTVHRLLGASRDGQRFRHHAGQPLACKVVLIDEASMLDLFLVLALTAALPIDANLVLLGDAEQLPSVDAGCVLRELVDLHDAQQRTERGPRAAVTRLTHSFRMNAADPAGSSVLRAAEAVRTGDTAALNELIPTCSIEALGFLGAHLVCTPASPEPRANVSIPEVLATWVKKHLNTPAMLSLGRGIVDPEVDPRIDEVLALLTQVRVLCVTRVLPTGSIAIGQQLALQVAAARGLPEPLSPYVEGTPVMVTKNLYDRGLYNGDTGIIVRAARGLTVAFSRRGDADRFIALDEIIYALEPAWATTVHKAQGAEANHCLIVLPDRDVPIASRELLYTAITRSRTSSTIVGTPTRLIRIVQRRIERASGLSERIQELLQTNANSPSSLPVNSPAMEQ